MPSDKPNYALVFKNTNREKENDREYQGHAEILCPYCNNAAKFWISGWKKVSQKAGDFLSLSFRQKEERQRKEPEIPFGDKNGGINW